MQPADSDTRTERDTEREGEENTRNMNIIPLCILQYLPLTFLLVSAACQSSLVARQSRRTATRLGGDNDQRRRTASPNPNRHETRREETTRSDRHRHSAPVRRGRRGRRRREGREEQVGDRVGSVTWDASHGFSRATPPLRAQRLTKLNQSNGRHMSSRAHFARVSCHPPQNLPDTSIELTMPL